MNAMCDKIYQSLLAKVARRDKEIDKLNNELDKELK